ncbi:globin [Necator americanus]|uniref:Globin n=1 Tax=Necator americanus TaxID=51031 RepID=W2SIK9_NECAM|nr:globin [Necator americanus]ETN68587.1 globin [Necator americanus]
MHLQNTENLLENALRLEIARLTANQRELIRISYQSLEGESTKNGMDLFVKLFAEFPNYKNIWPQFHEVADSSLIFSDKLRNHAKVYMAGLKRIVDVLDDNEKLIEATTKIASSHLKWNICKFHIEHMVPGLLEVLSICMGGKINQDVCEAWQTLYDIIGNMVNIQKRAQKMIQ